LRGGGWLLVWLGSRTANLLVVSVLASAACGQTLAHKGWAGSGITVRPWWEGAVLYQIDPVSFQDSKGDGFGDLKGIIQRLDYLQGLGVDAIVLSPFQLQPDFARAKAAPPFDPKYGTEEDLDQLILEASQHKIRVFVDLPLSASRTSQELTNVARFWLSRGIAGLRLTPDAPVGETHATGDRAAALTPVQVADRLRDLRRLCASYAGQRVLFWDLPATMPADASATSARHARRHTSTVSTTPDGVQMVADPRLALMLKLDATDLRQALDVEAITSAAATPVLVSDTANRPRSFDRLGDGVHDQELARVLATALLTSRGAPLLNFGQELGMATTPAPSPLGIAPVAVDPTPMQWGTDAGFTSGVPWVDMGRNAETANVSLEDSDSNSLLNWYRKLSALRHANDALRSGTMQLIAETNPDIVAWVRTPPAGGAAPVLVLCNLTDRKLLVSVSGDLRHANIQISSGMMHTLLSSALMTSSAALGPTAKEPVTGPVSVNGIALPPFGVYIGELPHQAGLESAPSPLRHSPRGAAKTTP